MASQSRRKQHNFDSDSENEKPMDINKDEEWTEKYQLLLQCLIHSRMVTKMKLSQVHSKLFHHSESLVSSLQVVTNIVSKLKMDIKEVKSDLSGETYYVIVHTTGESFFPRCCIFSKPQLNFLKKVLTSIVLSNNGTIGKIEALNSCSSMSKSDADEALLLFETEKILDKTDKGGICLTPLAVVEFGPFFKACFSDNMSTCDLCKQLVFVGRTCDNKACCLKYHHHCVSKWVAKKSDCPSCGIEWTVDMQADT